MTEDQARINQLIEQLEEATQRAGIRVDFVMQSEEDGNEVFNVYFDDDDINVMALGATPL